MARQRLGPSDFLASQKPLQSGVGGTELVKNPTAKQAEQNQLRLYRKYHELIKKCEKLDSDKIKLLEQIADNFS